MTIAFSPSVVFNNTFTFEYAGFRADVQTIAVSKQYLDNSGDAAYILKPYTYTNLRLSYTFHFRVLKDLELFLNVNNLFNTKYETNAALYTGMIGDEKYYDAYYFPQAGINLLGGVRVKF